LIVKKVLLVVAAAAALSAAVGVFVVALAFALYAVARDYVNPAGASAIVAGAAALLMLIGFLAALAKSGVAKLRKREASFADKAKDFVRERPLTAAIGALAAGVIAVRNPALLATIALSFFEGRSTKKR